MKGEDPSLLVLSRWLSPVQEALRAAGYEASLVIGGGARELLDHILFAAPLDLRDLDLAVIRGTPAVRADLLDLAGRLPGRPALSALRTRRRADRSGAEKVVGHGVHLSWPGGPILSLGAWNDADDLDLNGLFDIDTVALPLDNRRTLLDLACDLRACPAEALAERGRIRDPYGGYAAWRRRAPRVVHWPEVRRGMPRHALRIARTLARCGYDGLDEAWLREWRVHRPPAGRPLDDPREAGRDLLKLLGDPCWAEALVILSQLDALDPLGLRLAVTSAEDLRRRVALPAGISPGQAALARAQALLGDASSEDLEALLPSVFSS